MTLIMRALMVRSRSDSFARKFTSAADATQTVARRSPLRVVFRTSSACAVAATGATAFFTAKGIWAAFEDTLHGCSETQWYSFFAGCAFDTAMQPVHQIQHAVQTYMEQPSSEVPNWNEQIRQRARSLLLTDAVTHEELSAAAVQSRAWEKEKQEKDSKIAALEADLCRRSELNERQAKEIAGLQEAARASKESSQEEDSRLLAAQRSEEVARLENENAAHVQTIAKLEQLCEECKAFVTSKSDEIKTLELERQALVEKISHMEQARASSDEDLRKSIEELRVNNSKKMEEINRLERLSQKQVDEIARLEGLSCNQSEEIERLRGLSHNQADDIKQLGELNAKLEQQSSEFQARIGKLQAAEKSAKEKEEELRSQLQLAAVRSKRLGDELEATCKKLESEELRTKALAKTIVEKEAEISKARKHEDELKASHASDLAKIAADRKAREEEVRLQREQQLANFKKEQDEMRATLQKDIDALNARSALREKELQSELATCAADAKSREEKLLLEHAAKIGEFESLAKKKEEELRSHAQKLEQMEVQAQSREAELRTKMEAQAVESKALLGKLTAELEAAASTARSRQEEFQKQLQQATSRSEQLNDELAAVRSKLTSEAKSFQEKLDVASNRARKLEADLASEADARQKEASAMAALKAAHASVVKDLEQERKAAQADLEEKTLLRWEKKADARVISNLNRSNHTLVTTNAEQAEEIKQMSQVRQEQSDEITRLKQTIETSAQEISALRKSHADLEAASKKSRFW